MSRRKITQFQTGLFSCRFWTSLNQNELPLHAGRIFSENALMPGCLSVSLPLAESDHSVETSWFSAPNSKGFGQRGSSVKEMSAARVSEGNYGKPRDLGSRWQGKHFISKVFEYKCSALPLQQPVLPDTRADVLSCAEAREGTAQS